jgi:2-enoate reductase
LLLARREVIEPIAVIGGGLLGCETSLYLAQKGKKVTVVEMLDAVADDLYLANRMYLLKLLSDANVKTIIGERALEINSKGIRTINEDGKKNLLGADTIVLAAGLKSNNDLWENLRDLRDR